MRTTLSLPDDLHARLLSVSSDRHETLSRTVAHLLERALSDEPSPYRMVRNPRTGFIGFELGRVITEEDVRSLDDDE